MRQSLRAALLFPPLLVIGWYITAVFAWAGLVASLPGYYRWFIAQPIREQFASQQIILTAASGLASFLSALLSLSLAVFLFLRKPGDRAALFVSYYLLMYGLVMSGPIEMVEYLLFREIGGFSFRIQAILFTPLALLLLLLFPNGKISPARFRWLLPFIFLLTLLMLVLPSREVLSFATRRSLLLYTYTGILFLLCLGAQVYRYLRKSSPVERQQTKIVIFGIAIQTLFLAISSASWFDLPVAEQGILAPDSLLTDLFWWVSVAILPISLTLAVVRSHLWDIDVVIRRTLVYGFLTVTLALVYFGSVIMSQYAFRWMAGHESPIAIVLSTLAIAALFNPLRGYIQAVIDRRFFRSKYNSEQALARFQKSLRERVDLDQVERELTGIVQTTVQPEWMMVWIRKPDEQ